jgi:hypothetical protein
MVKRIRLDFFFNPQLLNKERRDEVDVSMRGGLVPDL